MHYKIVCFSVKEIRTTVDIENRASFHRYRRHRLMSTRIQNIAKLLASAALLATLVGCASSKAKISGKDDAMLPEIDVVQVKEYSEQALKLAQETKLDVQMLGNKLSETDNRVVALSEQVDQVSPAKIEELSNRIALLTEAFKDVYQKVAAIEILPQIKIPKTTTTKPAVFSPSDPSVLITGSDYDMYQTALSTFDAKSYDKARDLFASVIQKFPDGDYADKSQYWIGECFFAQGNYQQAVAALNKVLEYKNSEKADDATMKLALCYMRLGKNDIAAEQFQKLIDRYPASEYVPRAQKYLGEMKQ